jgi:predicted negative regulator of RcsB-dependent stress response
LSDYRTDEETVEQLARWWKENGTFLVITLLLVFGGLFGWRWWQDESQRQAQAASALYYEWLEARGAGEADSGAALAARLRSEYPESAYIALLAFDDAARAARDGDLAAARRALEEVLEIGATDAIEDIARLRLARIELDDGDPRAALVLVEQIRQAESVSAAEELRGDALLQLGRPDEARGAYALALTTAVTGRPLLEMKIDDLDTPREPGE